MSGSFEAPSMGTSIMEIITLLVILIMSKICLKHLEENSSRSTRLSFSERKATSWASFPWRAILTNLPTREKSNQILQHHSLWWFLCNKILFISLVMKVFSSGGDSSKSSPTCHLMERTTSFSLYSSAKIFRIFMLLQFPLYMISYGSFLQHW